MKTSRSNDGNGHFETTYTFENRSVTVADTQNWRGVCVTFREQGQADVSTIVIDATYADTHAQVWVTGGTR